MIKKKSQNKLPIEKRLFQSTKDNLALISSLKNLSFTGFKKEIKKAYKHPITKAFILGKHKPKSYNELRESRTSYFSDNLEGEIAWVLESILLSTTEIQEFLKLEKDLQKEILIGNISDAAKILDEIEENICVSYWGLEIRYFIIEKLHGTEGNWKFANQTNSSSSNSYTLFFNQIFSKKVEAGVSCSDYHRALHNEIRSANHYDFEYLNYKLSYHLISNYTHYPFLIYADSSSSIIDRYIALLNLLAELLSSNDSSARQIAVQTLNQLSEIDDNRIHRLNEFCGIKEVKIESLKYIEILELYSIGNYEKCVSEIPNILFETPNLVELWEIYVKSLIESGKQFISTNISEHFDELLRKLYISYSIENESVQKAEELLKIIIATPNFSFSKQLLTLVGSTIGIYSQKNVIHNNLCFHSTYSNPFILLQSENTKCEPSFEKLTTSICVKLMAGDSVDEKELQSVISKFKFNLYLLRRAFKRKEFDQCIKIGIKFNLEKIRNNIFIEEIVFILFHSYASTDQFDEAIRLYISCYFKNKNLIKRMNTAPLLQTIIEKNYPISGHVDSALFFHLNNLDNYHCFVSIEMWLESQKVNKPSEIDLPKDQNDLEKYLFILEHGCTIEVLEKFYYDYESKEDVIAERKKILSILIRNDQSNAKDFINELTSITQKEKIQSILHEVNSGRIRLTSSMLESSNENNFQNSFQRYRLLTEFTENFDFESYDSKTLLKNFLEAFVDAKNLSTNPSYLSFKSLVNELIDGFLFNKKNGLDGELSTRIRHGEFENQIRRVFDKYHLISKKDDTGLYTSQIFWDELLNSNLDENSKDQIHQILKEFSKKIDLMIQFLVTEYIQVKSENYPNKKHAFFNYHFTENYFKLIYEESRRTNYSYDTFVENIFSILKVLTESNLQNVSDYLTNTLRKEIDALLDKLGDKIYSISNNLVEINQNIVDAKVEFQNEILDISKWFVIADSTIESTMDVKTIIECAFESSNIQHPNTTIQPIINADENLFIRNYKHFIFILLNLIENIRIHSKLPNEKLEVFVEVLYDQDNLIFSVRNNFDITSINPLVLNNTFEKIKENWKNEVDQEYVNKERGSGYEKIKKILLYDIKSRKNSFDFNINENTLEVIFGVEISYNYKIDA
ncbi:MAG: hypothetical protein KGZ87_08745 [Bacteroidetes bacterium]|nr:hypothetical protein [Bacteroidota bacterium]